MQPGIIEVRWARPAAGTFTDFVMVWSLSTGIVVGVLVFVLSLFGGEIEADIVWHFEGVLAGLVSMLLMPFVFVMLGCLGVLWYPLFRLLAVITGGPKLQFRVSHGLELRFSRLCLRSFVMLASLCGLCCGILNSLIFLALLSVQDPVNISIPGLPAAVNDMPGVAWRVFAMPVVFAVYAGLSSVPASVPFRYVAHRRSRAEIFHSEIAPGR